MRRGFLKNPKAVADKTPLQTRLQEPPAPVQPESAPERPLLMIGGKLPYGKLESVALPTDYVPGSLSFPSPDALKAPNPITSSSMILTSIPTIAGELKHDGHTKCILRVETIAKILNIPGFPQPVPKSIGGPSYVVRSAPNMGVGVFATRAIKTGELVFAERPLLVSPCNIAQTINVPQEDLKKRSMDTWRVICMLEFEKQLEILLGKMTPEDQIAFKSLMNNHKEDGSGPLLGIVRTNAYGIDNLFDGPVREPDRFNLYGGVTKIGSRLNHSCMPNVTRDFSLSSFSFKFVATRDIAAGEQLFSSYCAVYKTVAERQAELAPYGFTCECSSCVNTTPETDKLRQECIQLITGHVKQVTKWLTSPNAVPEKKLDPVLQLREAMIKEGLQGSQEFGLLIASIYHFYLKMGIRGKANSYAEEYETYRALFL